MCSPFIPFIICCRSHIMICVIVVIFSSCRIYAIDFRKNILLYAVYGLVNMSNKIARLRHVVKLGLYVYYCIIV